MTVRERGNHAVNHTQESHFLLQQPLSPQEQMLREELFPANPLSTDASFVASETLENMNRLRSWLWAQSLTATKLLLAYVKDAPPSQFHERRPFQDSGGNSHNANEAGFAPAPWTTVQDGNPQNGRGAVQSTNIARASRAQAALRGFQC